MYHNYGLYWTPVLEWLIVLVTGIEIMGYTGHWYWNYGLNWTQEYKYIYIIWYIILYDVYFWCNYALYWTEILWTTHKICISQKYFSGSLLFLSDLANDICTGRINRAHKYLSIEENETILQELCIKYRTGPWKRYVDQVFWSSLGGDSGLFSSLSIPCGSDSWIQTPFQSTFLIGWLKVHIVHPSFIWRRCKWEKMGGMHALLRLGKVQAVPLAAVCWLSRYKREVLTNFPPFSGHTEDKTKVLMKKLQNVISHKYRIYMPWIALVICKTVVVLSSVCMLGN